MNRNLIFVGFLGMVLLLGSIPSSISDPDIPPFANPNAVTHMSQTAIDVLDNLPEPKSENERKKKFDIGFYDFVQNKIENRPNFYNCLSEIPFKSNDNILFYDVSESANPNSNKINIFDYIQDKSYCKDILLGNFTGKTISERIDEINYHTAMIIVNHDDNKSDGKSRAENNKNYLKFNLEQIGAKNTHVGKNLSFISAQIPIEQIYSLADYDHISMIGDGELKLDLMLEFSKNVVFADDPNFTGNGVTVAIIDSGIKQDHDDLFPDPPADDVVINQMVCETISGNLQCPSLTNTDYSDSQGAGFGSGHGTAVAGIIAGQGTINSSRDGLASEAKLLNAKVPPVPSVDEIAGAMDWSISNGARVINISIGDDSLVGQYPTLSLMADEAVDLGAIVVASAGNTGLLSNPNVTPPGTGFNVIAVGNMVDDRQTNTDPSNYAISQTSSRGPLNDGRLKPELVAPGTNVNAPDGGLILDYNAFTGTSFSAPHVSGASAILLESHLEFSALEVKGALIAGADWRGPTTLYSAVSFDAGSDQANVSEWGFGMLNVTNSKELTDSGNKIIEDVIEEESTISKEYSLSVTNNEIAKIFLTWFVNPSGTIQNPDIDLIGDFTLELRDDTNGLITISNSSIQNTEFIIFTPSETSNNYKLIVTAEDNFNPPDTFHRFVLASTNSITPLQTLHCMPPDSTPFDWIVDSDCILAADSSVNGNVTVTSIGSLTIPNGLTLDVDFLNKHVLVESGGKLLIENGGTLD